MSDEEGLSRLLKRGKRKNVVRGDGGPVDALVERLAKSSKARSRPQQSLERRSAELIERNGRRKLRNPTDG